MSHQSICELKAGAELIAQSYNHSYNMLIIITRGNNVYGPNQYPKSLVPHFINKLKNNEKVIIQGDGSAGEHFYILMILSSTFETILLKERLVKYIILDVMMKWNLQLKKELKF